MLDEMDFHHVDTPTSEVDFFNLTKCAEVTKSQNIIAVGIEK
jgi:hypothetical protein